MIRDVPYFVDAVGGGRATPRKSVAYGAGLRVSKVANHSKRMLLRIEHAERNVGGTSQRRLLVTRLPPFPFDSSQVLGKGRGPLASIFILEPKTGDPSGPYHKDTHVKCRVRRRRPRAKLWHSVHSKLNVLTLKQRHILLPEMRSTRVAHNSGAMGDFAGESVLRRGANDVKTFRYVSAGDRSHETCTVVPTSIPIVTAEPREPNQAVGRTTSLTVAFDPLS